MNEKNLNVIMKKRKTHSLPLSGEHNKDLLTKIGSEGLPLVVLQAVSREVGQGIVEVKSTKHP